MLKEKKFQLQLQIEAGLPRGGICSKLVHNITPALSIQNLHLATFAEVSEMHVSLMHLLLGYTF